MRIPASAAATAQRSAPRVFELVNEKSQVIGPDKCDTCKCQDAIDACPVQAISWGE